jgi:hypothetical protein
MLTVEKILPEAASLITPVCIKGNLACPPEDCGGIQVYEDLLEILADPEDPGHEDIMDWEGDDFDPERFDLNAVNRRLAKYMRKG